MQAYTNRQRPATVLSANLCLMSAIGGGSQYIYLRQECTELYGRSAEQIRPTYCPKSSGNGPLK